MISLLMTDGGEQEQNTFIIISNTCLIKQMIKLLSSTHGFNVKRNKVPHDLWCPWFAQIGSGFAIHQMATRMLQMDASKLIVIGNGICTACTLETSHSLRGGIVALHNGGRSDGEIASRGLEAVSSGGVGGIKIIEFENPYYFPFNILQYQRANIYILIKKSMLDFIIRQIGLHNYKHG